MGGFRTITRIPEITLGIQNITPPGAMYIQQDDQLFVQFQSTAATDILVTGRLLIATGEIVPFQFTFTSTGGSGSVTFRRPLAEGFLLSVAVNIPVSGFQRGQVYLKVLVQRGGIVGENLAAVLIQGYVSSTEFLTWPGGTIGDSREGRGFLRSITGTDPAAGAEISETVPANRLWYLHAITSQLVTAVGGADRRTILLLDDGTNVLARAPSGATQTAATTFNYSGYHAATVTSAVSISSEIMFSLPDRILLRAGYRIRTTTVNLAAGDNWGAPQLAVEEWLQF